MAAAALMRQATNPNQINRMKTQNHQQAATYLGLAEYRSAGKLTHSLYDGHDSPRAEGTVDEVIAHLESLLYLHSPDIEPLKWQGGNGWYYDGAEAGKALRSEIAALRDGSHWSLPLQIPALAWSKTLPVSSGYYWHRPHARHRAAIFNRCSIAWVHRRGAWRWNHD